MFKLDIPDVVFSEEDRADESIADDEFSTESEEDEDGKTVFKKWKKIQPFYFVNSLW